VAELARNAVMKLGGKKRPEIAEDKDAFILNFSSR
jgi:hypothetical protein